MANIVQPILRQRAEYTYKFNATAGRHGWLRLTPAYSVKVVEEIIDFCSAAEAILDPFCGTGTTALCAITRGRQASTVEINPFLVWLARAKTAQYSASTLENARKRGHEASRVAAEAPPSIRTTAAPEPPIHNIARWWSERARAFLCNLKASIPQVSQGDSAVYDLLSIAFCRTLIRLSNAAFNHQSMSFRSETQRGFDFESEPAVFLDELLAIVASAYDNPQSSAFVLHGNATDLTAHINGKFDAVITSPPYANRMSYIRELRPYMYWLGYLNNGREAGELDWNSLGGTWGIATSRLIEWEPSGQFLMPDNLHPTLKEIRRHDNRNGALLANYVARYCEGVSAHFKSLMGVLRSGAQLHYIIGNSTFYGVLVSTEEIYANLLRAYGFNNVKIRAIRKRNSNKRLVEYAVSATSP